jgi:hypothetical protein
MSIYDKLVYLTICEAAYERFKAGKFLTFSSYCNNLYTSIEFKNLSYSEKQDLLFIVNMVDKVYGMSFDETNRYVLNFLQLENIHEYEKCVRMTDEYFPTSKFYL